MDRLPSSELDASQFVIEPFPMNTVIGDEAGSPQLRQSLQRYGHVLDVIYHLTGDHDVKALGHSAEARRFCQISNLKHRSRASSFGSANRFCTDVKPVQLAACPHQMKGLMALRAADFKQRPDMTKFAQKDAVCLREPHFLPRVGEAPWVFHVIESVQPAMIISVVDPAHQPTCPDSPEQLTPLVGGSGDELWDVLEYPPQTETSAILNANYEVILP